MLKYGEDYFLGCRIGMNIYFIIGNFKREIYTDMLSGMFEIKTKISKLLNQCDYKKSPEAAEKSFLVKIGMPIEFTQREKYLNDGAMLDWLNITSEKKNQKPYKSDNISIYIKSEELYNSVLGCL